MKPLGPGNMYTVRIYIYIYIFLQQANPFCTGKNLNSANIKIKLLKILGM